MFEPTFPDKRYLPPANFAVNTGTNLKRIRSRQADFDRIKTKWLEIEERLNSAKQEVQNFAESEDESDLISSKISKIDAFDLVEYISSMSDLQTECAVDPNLLACTGVLQARCENFLVAGEFSIQDFNCHCCLIFGELTFLEDVHIVNSTFAKPVYFFYSEFKNIHISDCNFLENLDIVGSARSDLKIERSRLQDLNANVHVNGQISLVSSSFSQNVLFSGCFIGSRLVANNTTFESRFTFYNGEIGSLIEAPTICQSVDFVSSVFNGGFLFLYVRFFTNVEFNKAQIKDLESSFQKSMFMKGANFDNVEFECEANFENCVFFEDATFQNTKFASPSKFEKCVFHVPPRFHGSTLHQGSTFFMTTFPQGAGYRPPTWNHQDQMAFRTLKLLMAAQREQHQEAKFFALELKAQRQAEYAMRFRSTSLNRNARIGQPFLWVLSMLYYITSNYGQSPTRAINSFLIWNAGFGVLFWALEKWAHKIWIANYCIFKTCLGIDVAYQIFVVPASLTQTGSALARVPAFTLALQNTLNPLGLLSEKSLIFSQSLWIYCLSFIQSIGSLALFTLFLLAIRGRFQKGSGGGTA
ncbi:pentapeptide repeat-containing protein [Undibacterium umbellatum]|uniref:Pentapeptide repeat-containing protein n=1 Tax=Undibacterium umbellatum TaxID=2762300 RepID=A0ABR6Z3A3_9BURK|nr:pentapeptide repeat-containing protein [Undibacterium umbellatum]MBC3906185.1 pentapeptide repeat-containing protein [Undibacterium umbellatum]